MRDGVIGILPGQGLRGQRRDLVGINLVLQYGGGHAHDVMPAVSQLSQRRPGIGGVGIIGLVGIDRIADIVRIGLGHGLQVRQIQPGRLLEGAHHLIDPAGLRGAGERHKQVSGCIRLFHLVERALSDQSGQPTGIAGLGLRVRAGGLALGQRAQGRLLLQHGDIAGRRMHHVGACVYGFSLVGIERGIGNHRVIALLACCGQRIQRPTVVALPCVRGGCFGVASVGIPCGRLLGVPLLSGDAGLFVGRGIVQCGIGGDVEVGGLHDAGNGRLHCGLTPIQRIRDHLQRAVLGECLPKGSRGIGILLG